MRAGSPRRGRGVSQSLWACVLAGSGSQLPGIPIPTTATNSSQKQPPAGPVLDISDLPSHAQHLPSKAQDEHGWAARGQAPACLLRGPAPVGTLQPKSTLRLSRALTPEPWPVLGERETRQGERESAEAAAGQGAAPIASLWEGEQRMKC